MNQIVLSSTNLSQNSGIQDSSRPYRTPIYIDTQVKALPPEKASDSHEIKTLQIGDHQFAAAVNNIESFKNALQNKQRPCLVFVLKGQIEMFSETENQSMVAAGEAVFVENAHNITSLNQPNKTKLFEANLFFFNEDTLRSFCFQEGIKQTEAKPTAFFIPLKVDNVIHGYLSSIALLLNQTKASGVEASNLTKIKAIELLYLLYRANDDIQLKQALVSYDNAYSHRIQKIMESHFCEQLTIKQFAYLCSMSESSFKRWFGITYGMPPSYWVRKKRLSLAKKLLQSTDAAVSDISQRVGFKSLSYFFQSFKKQYSLTPAEIRSNKILN